MALLGAQPCTLYSHVDSPKGELNVHVHYLTYQFNIPMHQVSILLFRGDTAMCVCLSFLPASAIAARFSDLESSRSDRRHQSRHVAYMYMMADDTYLLRRRE